MVKYFEVVKEIDIPIFGYKVDVIFTNDLLRGAQKRNVEGLSDVCDFGAMHIYSEGNNKSGLLFPFNPPVDIIAHECYHAVEQILEHIRAKPESELCAYLLGFLVREVVALAFKYKRPKRT